MSTLTEKENNTPAAVIEDNDEGPPAKKQRYLYIDEPYLFVIKTDKKNIGFTYSVVIRAF